MNKIKFRDSCRVCGSKNLSKVLKLKKIPFTDEFVTKKNIGREFLHDLNIFLCKDCLTVQTQHDVEVERYYSDYQYSVGHSPKALKFMNLLARNINNLYFKGINKKSILEVGSGDGKQLNEFKKLGFNTLGFEPSGNLCKIANSNKIKTVKELFTRKSIRNLRKKNVLFDIILLTYTFDHLPEPGNFLSLVKKLLKQDGIIIVEVHDLEKIFKNLEFCLFEHEHSIYLTQKTAKNFLELYDYNIINFNIVEESDRRANSLIFVANQKSSKFRIKPALDKLPQKFGKINYYSSLENIIKKGISNLEKYISVRKHCGKKIAGYGAGGRGVMTLAGMKNSSCIDFLVEKNPKSSDIYTPSSGIPIVGLDYLKENSVDEILVFSYGYMEEIKSDLAKFGYREKQIKSFINIMKDKNV